VVLEHHRRLPAPVEQPAVYIRVLLGDRDERHRHDHLAQLVSPGMVQGEPARGQRLARAGWRREPVHAYRPGCRRYRLGIHLLPQPISRGSGSACREGGTLPVVPVGQVSGSQLAARPRSPAEVGFGVQEIRIHQRAEHRADQQVRHQWIPGILAVEPCGKRRWRGRRDLRYEGGGLLDRGGPPRLHVRVRRPQLVLQIRAGGQASVVAVDCRREHPHRL
jgi:hypothetical protein